MRSLCVIAAALSLAAFGQARPGIKFVDGTDTFTGPARGYAPGGWKVFEPKGLPRWRGAKAYNSSLWELSRFSGGRVQGKHAAPKELKPGTYDFLLRVSAPLKDEKPGGVPRRPIRLANEGMWNEALKANMLGQVLSVTR